MGPNSLPDGLLGRHGEGMRRPDPDPKGMP